MYIVAGTAFDVNSSSRDGFSRRLVIMDAATEGAATPIALRELPVSMDDSETNTHSAYQCVFHGLIWLVDHVVDMRRQLCGLFLETRTWEPPRKVDV